MIIAQFYDPTNNTPKPKRKMYVTILVFALNVCYPAVANPVQAYYLELLDARDDTSSNNQFFSPKAWVPITVVVLLLCLVALMTWSRNSLHHAVSVFGGVYGTTRVETARNPTGAGRELTAEQLVGSINATDLPTSRAGRQAGRTRRPGRTPSQVSVTSLPAYNKEPGEEELVIFRGRDMEDATMPPATVVEEDDSSLNSQDHLQVSRYSPMPTTSNEMPLLHNDDYSGDLSLQRLQAQSPDIRRPSLDASLQETSSLMRADSNLPRESSDPRGEAPPYFEVVDHTPEFISVVPTAQTSSFMPTSTLPEPQQRRSGFRIFLNRMSIMSRVPEHRRTETNQSASTSNSRSSTPSRTSNHRITPSGSGSVVTASMFRTISRQRSSQTLNSSVRLNSPSLISLNSISSPLSHTLVRTEFTYPKSGPTPEQLKVISSRENFSRFGVPYGRDAIAFAASSSRQDLEPPPGFETSSSQLSLVRPGLSRLDSSGSQSRSEPALGREAADQGDEARSSRPLSVNTPSEIVTSISSIMHAELLSAPKIPDPDSSSSTFTHTDPALLPPITEFGKLHNTSLTPQDAITRSESRASNYSFQSYATASESLGRARMGADSGHSTPRLGDSGMTDEVSTARME